MESRWFSFADYMDVYNLFEIVILKGSSPTRGATENLHIVAKINQ